MLIATMKLHLVLEKRNVVRLGRDLRKPMEWRVSIRHKVKDYDARDYIQHPRSCPPLISVCLLRA